MSKAEKFSICDQCGSSWPTHKFYNCPSCEALNFKDCQRRELVKQYAGQIFAGFCSNSKFIGAEAKSNQDWAIDLSHALAKAVLESLKEEV